MKKQIIVVLLALMLVLCLSSAAAAAEIIDSGTCGADGDNLTWTLDDEGVLTISGTGEMADYDYGHRAPWYSYYDRLSSVLIEDGVTSIGSSAFYCSGVDSFTIPDSVINIGFGAFSFSGLNSVTIGNGVTNIGSSAFYDSGLKSVTIPDSVTSIGDLAFSLCRNLTSVTIGNRVTNIGDGAFGDCERMTDIDVVAGNQTFSSIDGVLYNYSKTELLFCPDAKRTVYIPVSVTDIVLQGGLNEDRSQLAYINVEEGNQFYSSTEGVLFNKDGTLLIRCPNEKRGVYSIPDGVNSIQSRAFQYCDYLTNVVLPESVVSVGEMAFYGCHSLNHITIPDSITVIEGDTFGYCVNLSSVIIPDSITRIGDGAFTCCYSLTSVIIPDSVTNIGAYAFLVCDRLTDVYYAGTPEKWDGIEIDEGNEPLYNATIHYNYIENHLTVTVAQSGDNWQDGELRVPYGGTAELKIIASATDGDLSYRWVKVCEGGDIVENGTLPSTGDTQTITNVTQDGLYVCYVTDMYGTERYAAICVRVGGELEAQAVGDDYYYVTAGDTVSLQVNVTSGNTDDISCVWWQRYYDAESEGYIRRELEGENSNTLEITSVDQSASYECEVRRPYYDYDYALSEGYVDESSYERFYVWFDVYVDNNFSVECVGATNVYVPYGETTTLEVMANATDTTGLTYRWTKNVYTYYESGELVEEVVYDDTDNSLITDSVISYCVYICQVNDRYGNEGSVWFFVGVENNFSAELDHGTGGDWVGDEWLTGTLHVLPGNPASLKVLVDADNKEDISYEWTRFGYVPETGGWGDVTLDSTTDSLTMEVPITGEYYCRVTDCYGNSETVACYIKVDNSFRAELDCSSGGNWDGDTLYVDYGAPATVKVLASSDDAEGITYRWSDGSAADTLTIDAVTAYSSYHCEVCDRYGNHYYVWVGIGVDNGFSVKAVGNTNISVPYGETAALELDVTANDREGLSYSWEKFEYVYLGNTYWSGRDTVYYDNDSPVMTTEAITTRSRYTCTIHDRFGNPAIVRFDVGVDNGLSASAFGTDSDVVEVEVPLGESASLKVEAKAIDFTDGKYYWLTFNPYIDENGKPLSITVASGTDLALIDGSGINDSLEASNVTKSKWYFGRIIDRFANMVEVFFHVKVANELTVTPEQSEISVPSGSSQTLVVDVSASDMEDIVYTWAKAICDEQGGVIDWEDLPCSEASLLLENVTEPAVYMCRVTDKYDNYVNATFLVNVLEESGYAVTLSDLTKGIASISDLDNGGIYSGETTFIVSCTKACAVLYTTDGGQTYSRLKGTKTADNKYSFTVDVTKTMTIVVALKSDVNMDGRINALDVAMTKAGQLNKITLTPLQRQIVDVNADGRLNALDVAMTKAGQLNKIRLDWDK